MNQHIRVYLQLMSVVLIAAACTPRQTPRITRLAPEQADSLAKAIEQSVSVQLADGLQLHLWASDSLAPDPIALTTDPQGRVYITRTNRQKNSEFDIRGHIEWATASISWKTVEDRRAFLRAHFAPENSEENSWLPDLNGDSLHDWHDLTVEKEQVFCITDTDGDGLADASQLYLEDFHEEVTDVAGAVLLQGKDMFLGVGPDMWRIRDRNGDGMADFKESISHGYAVHIGFSGHGMSGLTMGPDGRVYWSIGDIGFHVTDQTGRTWPYPNQGAIFRADADGSNFEVFAAGLRNTHEFVFDEYGNLFSVDNDGDHPGEKERLVYIVNGSDAGWRANWQYGKYTDPDNNRYKVWMDESLYKPRFEGQAAYIVPPIVNYHSGPTGMKYNPGTALGPYWRNKFFIVEFPGTPARAHLYAFQLKPQGAGFEFAGEEQLMQGVLATGIDFGPDGALYIADWLEGWGTKNRGRIWRMDVEESQKDPLRAETQALLAQNFSKKSPESLAPLLQHPDMRVRLQAQYALAGKKDQGHATLLAAAQQKAHQLARIHGLWGMAQMARKQAGYAAPLATFLQDEEAEIRAQAAKMIGNVRYEGAGDVLISLLKDPLPRVRFFAAEALGRTRHQAAVQPLLDMLEANDDADLYLRHAGALALARIGQPEPLTALATHPSRSLRIAAVVALRRMRHVGVSSFLHDPDEWVVTEAARAINDDLSIPEALPALARLLEETPSTQEALLRRAINANLRVGTQEQLQRLAAYVKNPQAPAAMREEALHCLGVWPSPSVLDRVDGRYRGPVQRAAEPVRQAVAPLLAGLFQPQQPAGLQEAAAQVAGRLHIPEAAPHLLRALQRGATAQLRINSLQALHQLQYDHMPTAIGTALADSEPAVRAAALGLIPQLQLPDAEKVKLLATVIQQGAIPEQQQALVALGQLGSASEKVLGRLLDDWIAGRLDPAVQIDLAEAIASTGSDSLMQKLQARQQQLANDLLATYAGTLSGGDAQKGREIFIQHAGAQCMRCHAVGPYGGDVGPPLTDIGARLSPEELLLSLVDPSARIAPGYGNVLLTLKDGSTVSGILQEETPTHLLLKSTQAEPLRIAKARIEKRQHAPSAMPSMKMVLSQREIRDLLAFLQTLKGRES